MRGPGSTCLQPTAWPGGFVCFNQSKQSGEERPSCSSRPFGGTVLPFPPPVKHTHVPAHTFPLRGCTLTDINTLLYIGSAVASAARLLLLQFS